MKRKIFTTLVLAGCFATAFAYFADMNGKWTGVINAPDGNQYPLSYTFKTDGNKLTGAGESPQGPLALTDGKVKGDSLSFSVDVNGTGVLNSGKYYSAGDSISLNIDYQGFKLHATLKRAADK